MPTIVTMIAIDKGLSVGIWTGILTVIIIVFGEVLPKTIAATFADRVAYMVSPSITLLVKSINAADGFACSVHKYIHPHHFERGGDGSDAYER